VANSQTKNSFEYSENKKQRRIERKYNKLIGQALIDYNDRTMGELFEYLDMLKAEMEQELIKAGAISEDK
jgi:hypothetical protein